MLAALVLALAVSACASEQSDLIRCFLALRPHSEGPGLDAGLSERGGGPLTPTILVGNGKEGAQEGFWIYSGQAVFAQKLPPKFRGGAYRIYPFELNLPERGPIRCVYRATTAQWFDCGLADREPEYAKAAPKRMPEDDKTRWPLKSAVLLRLQDAGGKYSKSMTRYVESLESWKKDQDDPGAGEQLRRFVGWGASPKPSPPYKGTLLRELQVCADTEDVEVREATRSLLHYIDTLPTPR